jgi:hypothetical protein
MARVRAALDDAWSATTPWPRPDDALSAIRSSRNGGTTVRSCEDGKVPEPKTFRLKGEPEPDSEDELDSIATRAPSSRVP